MNNYMTEVRKYLGSVPAEDLDDLMQYYEEYFYDAGLTDEQALAKYGRPKKFAQFLKTTYFLEIDDKIEQTSGTKSRLHLVWLIILGLFASPLLVPLAIAAVLVILALLLSFLVIVLSVYAVVLSLIVGGIFSAIAGIAVISQDFVTAVTVAGAGLLAFGLGLIFAPFLLKFTLWLFNLFIKFVKWIGRKFTGRSNFSRKGGL